MNATTEKDKLHHDYYKATLENGNLAMTPYCACGNALNDDYFCEKCSRRCRCYEIVCDNTATLDRVKKYIRKSSKFVGYTAVLTDEK